MNVQSLKAYVREQMDVDEEDLPDSVLDVYLQEAFDRTMAFENRWPRNEFTWQVTKLAGSDVVTLPADLLLTSIMSVRSLGSDNYLLVESPHETALGTYSPYNGIRAVGRPVFYSIWNQQLYLWPGIDTDQAYDLQITGYRQPVWSNAASAIPDLDPRLHATLAYFALSLAYAKEEDEIMEAAYYGRWNRDLQQQLKSIRQPSHARPLVLHGGAPIGGVSSWVVNPPEVP